jgi:chemotaxis regulatin CheY-phosphate phosphatase CheZ
MTEVIRTDNTDVIANACKKIADLEKENAELRKEWQEQVQKAIDEGYARTLQTMQLNKVKEIIKKIDDIFYSGENAIKRLSKISDILAEAEQFLKECK